MDSVDTSLTTAEVEDHRSRGETNEVENSTSRSLASIAKANIFTLFNGILTAAMIVVLVVGNWRDAIFGGVMIINALIGIASEYRAKRTLDALAIVEAPRAVVVRDGARTEIPTAQIVLDDVVELKLGDQVPIDGKLVEVSGLDIDESMLTGESVPIRKGTGDKVLAGTAVVAGSGIVRATAVGKNLYAQGITKEARQFSLSTSEIQQGINKVLRVISWVIVPVVVLMVWSQTRIAGGGADAWRSALVLAISAVVGMIPQGLVLLTSMNFALGSATLARRGVLVQELPAVETLARVDALCLDKTGTLTTGGIRVRAMERANGVSDDLSQQLRTALEGLSNDRANATAIAISDALSEGNLDDVAGTGKGGPTLNGWTVAFSSVRKWSAWGDESGTWILGAPEIIIDASRPTDKPLFDRAEELAGQGLRVVAVVHAEGTQQSEDLPGERVAMALLVLEEDIRPDAAETLTYFRDQGVHVRVISGDNPVTVSTIARGVGLRSPDGGDPRTCDARTLPSDLDSSEFVEAVDSHDVFGRVTPEQKRAMVRALKARGHAVAMTGDGVNDALALKDADLGIAMGNGASATKAVAQLVLVDGQFSVLPGVVAEGRRIIANMERVSSLFLAKTTYASIIAVLTALIAWPYPFLPRHFTYIDAFTIGIPAFFIALGPNTRRYVPGFLRRTLALAVPSGIVLAFAALVAYAVVGVGSVSGRTVATLTLMAGATWLLSITARPLLPSRIVLLSLMVAGAVLGVLIPLTRTFFALEWPGAAQWAVIIGIGAFACLLIELGYRACARPLEKQVDAKTDSQE